VILNLKIERKPDNKQGLCSGVVSVGACVVGTHEANSSVPSMREQL